MCTAHIDPTTKTWSKGKGFAQRLVLIHFCTGRLSFQLSRVPAVPSNQPSVKRCPFCQLSLVPVILSNRPSGERNACKESVKDIQYITWLIRSRMRITNSHVRNGLCPSSTRIVSPIQKSTPTNEIGSQHVSKMSSPTLLQRASQELPALNQSLAHSQPMLP